jgi:non-specific serine/threonine protein kinase/serine/threonine-protein kinase
VSSRKAVDANAARQLADERLENMKKARNEAATESAVARAVNDFLQRDLLGQVHRSPWDADEFVGTPDLTVREALDRAAATIGERFRDQAQVEAAVRLAIGGAYASLHRHQLALPHFEKALALRRAILGSDHADTLDAARRLADIYAWVGRFHDGVAVLDAVLGKYERLFGPDHPTTLDCVRQQSLACNRAGMWDRAIMLAKRVMETRSATLGPAYRARAGDMQVVASCYSDAGLFVESIAWHEKTMAICEATQQHDLYPSNNYARALQGVGRLEEADHELRKALERACKQRDRRARERQCAVVQKVLGLNLLLQGRYTEAEAVAREALAVLERYTPDHWSRFHAMSMVGGALQGQQRYSEAESCLVQGYEGMKQREATIDACFDHWLTKAGERLVRFYDVTDQPEKSRLWRERILQGKSMN